MSIPDIINGVFESCGGLLIWQSVRKLRVDKEVKGVHWAPILFFTLWGFWNLYFYPHLGQWVSFYGGISTAAVNLVWLILIIYYWRK